MMTSRKLKLGVIGMSDGNGHPYSWSSIFNGYNLDYMKECPFPVIPDYLGSQRFPNDFLTDLGEVTHIWTQDSKSSQHIADSCLIRNIVSDKMDMIGSVDAILLARDDTENHFKNAKPFLEAGIPIFIDKPIALSKKRLQELIDAQQYDWQLFSCTALRYATELKPQELGPRDLGDIGLIEAFIPKNWEKYSVHIVEPVLGLRNDWGNIIAANKFRDENTHSVTFAWENGIRTTFNTLGELQCPLSIMVYGTGGFQELRFQDTFSAFKNSLAAFVEGVREKKIMIPRSETKRVVEVIERGLI